MAGISAEEGQRPGPFAGLRIVEFGRFIAAPYCGQLFADGGADVIKVEPLQGDETRISNPLIPGEGRQFLNKNRNKRSIAVDLHNERVVAALQRLAAGADVVIANFRPGVAQRLGLDYASLSAANPRLIYAENTAFGDKGPLAGAPGLNGSIEAYSGMLQLTEDGLRAHGDPFIDYEAATLLAWGITAALYQRERNGRGQIVTTSLLQAALTLQNDSMNLVERFDGARLEASEQLKADLAAGAGWAEAVRRRHAKLGVNLAAPYNGVRQTNDGFLTIICPTRPIRRRLLEVLGLHDRWIEQPGWEPEDPAAHALGIGVEVEARFLEDTTEAWLGSLRQAGVPSARVQLTREDVLRDPQVLENGHVVTLDHELLGPITVVAPPVGFSDTPLSIRWAPPALGSHTREILRETGLEDDVIAELIAEGAVRDGSPPQAGSA